MAPCGQALEEAAWAATRDHVASNSHDSCAGSGAALVPFSLGLDWPCFKLPSRKVATPVEAAATIPREHSNSCIRQCCAVCGAGTEASPMHITHVKAGVVARCATCWLTGGNGAGVASPETDESAVLALGAVKGGAEVLKQLINVSRPGGATGRPTHGRAALRSPPTNAPALEGRICIIWDSLDEWCALLARALHHEFAALLVFADVNDDVAVESLLCGLEVSTSRVATPGAISAVLPSSVFITGVESNPKVLFWELHYLRTLVLPKPETTLHLEREWLEPIAELRVAAQGAARWWASSEARDRILASLQEQKFAVIDGFLPDETFTALADDARALHVAGELRLGREEQQGTHGVYWGSDAENEADFLNIHQEPRKWTVQGDCRRWLPDGSPLAPTLELHTSELDSLIVLLRGGVDPLTGSHIQSAEARLRHADFREYGMIACYPGDGGGRYHKHSDVNRNAVLTAILYLNETWDASDGGIRKESHLELRVG